MSYIVTAVVFVGLLCVLNLLLTFGVVRRLRQHTELLSQPVGQAPPREVFPAGSAPGGFEVTDTRGETVSTGWLAGRAVVGFFSTGCGPCYDQLPAFVDVARALQGSGYHVMAVVIGEGDEAAAMAGALEPVARVVNEPLDGPVALAFGGVAGTPSLAVIDESGEIVASGHHVSQLPVPAVL